MLTIHIFGKSEGCTKCAALKRKVASVMDEEKYRGRFVVSFHDVLTLDGLLEFCRSNISPNSLPGLLIGIGPLFLKSSCTAEEWLERGNLLRPWLGLLTDYGERHKGVITTDEIRWLMDTAIDICEVRATDEEIFMKD